jgi:DNA-binding response OmpR family regulator
MSKVLIVDDEEVARTTLAEIFRLEGFDITAVESGEAAVVALAKEPYDAMILDLKMPGMGGMEVLRTVMASMPQLSVIVLTAYGTMDSAIQAIRYRVHDYLLKPVSPHRVVESVEYALLQKRQGQMSVRDGRSNGRSHVEHLPGGALLAWDKRQISWTDGNLSLTPTEARLLKTLFERKNEMIAHSELVFLIQGYSIDTEEAAKILRPVVSRLRQKLLVVPGWGDRIKNVRGAGYVLELI